jgi:hypothetical protein
MQAVIIKYNALRNREIGFKLLAHLQCAVMDGFRGAGGGQFNKVNMQ